MTTTIKVDDALRDRLKAQAALEGLTLGAHLSRLADEEDRRLRLRALRIAVERTSASSLESYAHETEEWERTELADAS